MKRFSGLLIGLLLVVMIAGGATSAFALHIDATVTADNYYALYYGNVDLAVTDPSLAVSLNYVGRNEAGSGGAPGTYNWSVPETFEFDMTDGDYIYIAAWSDGSTAQALLGQFITGTSSIYTNTSDWEVYRTGLGAYNPDTDLTSLSANIYGATYASEWASISDSKDNGASPWGLISDISADADWIWGSNIQPGSTAGEYQIFRTKVNAPVPEPATMLLFGIGLLGMAGVSRRKK